MRHSRKIPFQFFSTQRFDQNFDLTSVPFVIILLLFRMLVPLLFIIIYGQRLWLACIRVPRSNWHACHCRINIHSDTMLCNHFIISIFFSRSVFHFPVESIYMCSQRSVFYSAHRVFLTLIRCAERNYYLIPGDRVGAHARSHAWAINSGVSSTYWAHRRTIIAN